MPLGAEAREIIARLGAVNLSRPRLNRSRVEAALLTHLAALGQPARPVVWVSNVGEVVDRLHLTAARAATWDATWDAARDAAGAAAGAAAWDKLALVERPFVDAFEAGLGMFWVTPSIILAMPQPLLQVECGANARLHCETGPAVTWPDGERHWFWHGVRVPRLVVEQPAQITSQAIVDERNAEVRRVMIERFGWERFDVAVQAQVIDHDERWGTLLRWPSLGHEPILALRVVNRSPEPDGSFRRYVLPVHPELRPLPDPERGETAFGARQRLTALNAVASTFGMLGADYAARLWAES